MPNRQMLESEKREEASKDLISNLETDLSKMKEENNKLMETLFELQKELHSKE